jgi:hypothetical protein
MSSSRKATQLQLVVITDEDLSLKAEPNIIIITTTINDSAIEPEAMVTMRFKFTIISIKELAVIIRYDIILWMEALPPYYDAILQ